MDGTVSELKIANDISNDMPDQESSSSRVGSPSISPIRESISNQESENLTEDLTKDSENEAATDYEQQRRRNILENQKLLQELGLNSSPFQRSFSQPERILSSEEHDRDEYIPTRFMSSKPRKIGQKRVKPVVELAPTRLSKRIRGIEAKTPSEKESAALSGDEDNFSDDDGMKRMARGRGIQPSEDNLAYSRSAWTVRKNTIKKEVPLTPVVAGCPISLRSIGTTVWELGKLYTGTKFRLKYWSSKGSIYRHPYPIGYRAEKQYFGERYMMHISEGPEGPLFTLESERGKVFEGSSPTHPWTQVCLASHSKGTRVSGPLFYGFSDPIVQSMIVELEGYERYEDVVAKVKSQEALADQQEEGSNGTEEGVNGKEEGANGKHEGASGIN